MPFLELFDETLDINSTENYECAIQIGSENLSFCLLDTIRNKYVMLRSFSSDKSKDLNSEQIIEIIENDDFLLKHYKKVSIIIPSQKFTLVPTQLFDPARKDDFFTLNHIPNEDSIVLSNKISDPDSYINFSVQKSLNEILTTHFPGVLLYIHLKPLLNYISIARKSVSGNYIHVNIERDFFDIIVFTGNTLKFCNSFIYRNINDIIYFVMNVFRTLELKQEETIHFSGMTEKYDDLTSAFSIYVRGIKFSEPTGNFTFSYVFNETPMHRYLNLFTVLNCV